MQKGTTLFANNTQHCWAQYAASATVEMLHCVYRSRFATPLQKIIILNYKIIPPRRFCFEIYRPSFENVSSKFHVCPCLFLGKCSLFGYF